MKTDGGDGNETGLVTEEGKQKKRRLVSVPASPGLQGDRSEQQLLCTTTINSLRLAKIHKLGATVRHHDLELRHCYY